MDFLVIANPVAGGGRGRRLAQQVAARILARGHRCELFLTGRAGDGAALVGQLGEAVRRVVVVGGDGTVAEVFNGLPDPSRVALLQLPTGTANLLAKDLGLPRDPGAVARLAIEGRERVVDYGTVRRVGPGADGTRRFLMVVSAGFDGAVARAVHASRGARLGYHGYLAPLARTLAEYGWPRFGVSVNGGPPQSCGYALVSKVRCYAGLFTVADRARLDSGHLDVCLFPQASPLLVPRIMAAGLLGKGADWGGGSYQAGHLVRFESRRPIPVEVDGDPWGETPIEIGIVPGGARLVVP